MGLRSFLVLVIVLLISTVPGVIFGLLDILTAFSCITYL